MMNDKDSAKLSDAVYSGKFTHSSILIRRMRMNHVLVDISFGLICCHVGDCSTEMGSRTGPNEEIERKQKSNKKLVRD